MRLAVDTGGTFTDLVVEDDRARLHLFKAPTTPRDPVQGVLDVLENAARGLSTSREALLAGSSLFIHGTTRAINAVLTGTTARTAFLTTQGHPDILLFREGGRSEPFNWSRPYPEPYVPRALTFEVPERIGAAGEVVQPLDEAAVVRIARRLAEQQVEAVGVCLLWSIVNPAHELRVGELLTQHLPGVPYTLSHQLNPTLREYRRASSACLDASLKPLMQAYLGSLTRRLEAAGFGGRVLMVTSSGGSLDAVDVAAGPIHALNSGPAMAPVAGRYYALEEVGQDTAIVADTGGTTYDVSLVRRGRIPVTRETWIGPRFFGHQTGFPSVDVKSIGAGGGSIARVDEGGLLHVGPASAGADPGPVCYGRGGTRTTVTDACLVLGYLDPAYFLGGTIRLDCQAAETALREQIADPLGLELYPAAAAVLEVLTEQMVRGIEEITLFQGIDPRGAVLVGGGGAAGLNSVQIARRLGCPTVLIPTVGPVLSAAGALLSDLSAEYGATHFTTSARFDRARANAILARLTEQCQAFVAGPGAGSLESAVELMAEARYPSQIWELELPVPVKRFETEDDLERLRQDFHALHREIFAIDDPASAIEMVGWRARVRCRLRDGAPGLVPSHASGGQATRQAYFPGRGLLEIPVRRFESLKPGVRLHGPLIVESPIATVVIDPEASVELGKLGSLIVTPVGAVPVGTEDAS